MGTRTRDIFGDADGVQPATPGSYGEPPRNGRLPGETHLGEVRLQISDLQRSLDFYENVLGLRVAERGADSARLTAQGEERVLLELRERPGVRRAGVPARLGLYHYAILLPDRASLGRLVRHFAANGVAAGAGDHLVSEAFYLSDPDGLGIEVYADRPRSTWRRVGRELMLATDPVDIEGVVAAAGGTRWDGMPAGTVMGHVHLHVGNLAQAAAFYADAIGFDRMVWSYPGALFLGAGGYHHHLGMNTWAGAGARPATDDDARLLEWTIELPDTTSLAAAADRLAAAGYDVARSDDGVRARDPWGTAVLLRAQLHAEVPT